MIIIEACVEMMKAPKGFQLKLVWNGCIHSCLNGVKGS
jgi:hypothetical protein